MHGGLSPSIETLDGVRALDRVQEVPHEGPMTDLLWSDPKNNLGCINNITRGGGTCFGPDVSNQFLADHELEYMIRSHECVPSGWKISHGGKVITVFSSSDYYHKHSNIGAYIKIDNALSWTPVSYEITEKHRKNKVLVKADHDATVHCVRELISLKRPVLQRRFAEIDVEKKGYISLSDWYMCMQQNVDAKIPWLSLKADLVVFKDNNASSSLVDYHKCFLVEGQINGKLATNDAEHSLFEIRSRLHALFSLIDTDNSGGITREELLSTYAVVSKNICKNVEAALSDADMAKFVDTMDVDGDGKINFNEFFASFKFIERTKKK